MRRTPSGLYRLQARQSDPAYAWVRGVGAFLLLSLVAMTVATEVTAAQLHFHRALGPALAGHLYEPWSGLTWMQQFRHAADPRVRRILSSFWMAWGIGELGALFVAAVIVARGGRARRSDLHGSAHWASTADVRRMGLLDGDGGVYVGAFEDGGRMRYLRHDGPEHVLAFAPTRSGKGVGLVLPTLLSWPHSVIVHDIKGENFALTAGWRQRELGSAVWKFDPASADGSSCRYNPLDAVRIGTDSEIKDVQNIVQMLVDPDGRSAGGEESHWIATSSALLAGVILHVLYAEPEKNLSGVAGFLSDPSFESPLQMYHTMLSANHGNEGGPRWRDASGSPTATHPVVAMAARDMLNRDPKEATSVLSTAIRFLTLFRDPIVARNTSASDFTIADLMNGARPASLYLVVPPSDIDRLKPLTRLVLNQLLRSLTAEMHFEGGRSVAAYKHRMLLMIDELPSLGRLEILQQSLAFMAGYGIKAYLIAQDVAQLSAAYGGATGRDEAIMANCHVQIAFAANRVETMELISKLLGSMTVQSETKSYSGRRVGFHSTVMVNAQETERPLLTPDEVRRLPEDDALVLVAGQPPVYAKKIKYYRDPVFSERAKISYARPVVEHA